MASPHSSVASETCCARSSNPTHRKTLTTMTRPPLINDKTMSRYTAIVTIATNNIDNAEKVLNERIHYDENYGFPYEINYDELQPEKYTRGIIIDASVIRDKLDSLMYMLDEDNPDDQRILDAHDRIKSIDDGNLNALISSINDERAWELFNEVCDRVLDWIIDDVNSSESSS